MRPAEAFDLAGVAREHALDALAGALAIPIGAEPPLIAFAPEGRGRARLIVCATVPAGLPGCSKRWLRQAPSR